MPRPSAAEPRAFPLALLVSRWRLWPYPRCLADALQAQQPIDQLSVLELLEFLTINEQREPRNRSRPWHGHRVSGEREVAFVEIADGFGG